MRRGKRTTLKNIPGQGNVAAHKCKRNKAGANAWHHKRPTDRFWLCRRICEALAALTFQVESGADEAIEKEPVNRYRAARSTRTAGPGSAACRAGTRRGRPAPAPAPPPDHRPARPCRPQSQATDSARSGAARMHASLEELREMVSAFDGCALRQTATNTVFADGNPEARVMIVGEAPGREEDLRGLPFVGESGRLMDRMLAAIGLDRDKVYISNILPWRPPGNRKPTTQEITICLPFIERHIELSKAEILVLRRRHRSQHAASSGRRALPDCAGAGTDIRPRKRELGRPAGFPPRLFVKLQPGLKREAWADFLKLKERLVSLGVSRRGPYDNRKRQPTLVRMVNVGLNVVMMARRCTESLASRLRRRGSLLVACLLATAIAGLPEQRSPRPAIGSGPNQSIDLATPVPGESRRFPKPLGAAKSGCGTADRVSDAGRRVRSSCRGSCRRRTRSATPRSSGCRSAANGAPRTGKSSSWRTPCAAWPRPLPTLHAPDPISVQLRRTA